VVDIQRKPNLPSGEGVEWLDLLVADEQGVPHRVMAIGPTVMLDNGDHVPVGLIRNGYRAVWKPA